MRAIPLSNVESKVESRFSSAGVNQTKLEVNVTFTVELCAMLAGAQAETTVTSEVCVRRCSLWGRCRNFMHRVEIWRAKCDILIAVGVHFAPRFMIEVNVFGAGAGKTARAGAAPRD